MRQKVTLSRILSIFLCSLASIGCLFPLVWLINFSLVKTNQMFNGQIFLWPETIEWKNYQLALNEGKVPQYLVNSVMITVLSVGLIILLSVMMSYGFTRMKWKISKLVLNMVLLGFMIPIHSTLLPNFLTFAELKMQDNPLALIIPYVAFGLPQATFIMTGFMHTIPDAVEESAFMDGSSIFRLLFQIIVPMVKPAIVTVVITSFISIWNEFIMAATFLSSDRFRTLPFSVWNFQGQYSANLSAQFAVMTLSALPSLVAYVILNKHITKGMAAGAVKG